MGGEREGEVKKRERGMLSGKRQATPKGIDPFAIYINMESPQCTPEINIMLYINNNSIKKIIPSGYQITRYATAEYNRVWVTQAVPQLSRCPGASL